MPTTIRRPMEFRAANPEAWTAACRAMGFCPECREELPCKRHEPPDAARKVLEAVAAIVAIKQEDE